MVERRSSTIATDRHYTYLKIGARLFRAKVAFVGSVAAVVFGVAFPRGRHATAVFAQELGRRARDVRAPCFVTVVAAVVFAVAPERTGYATAGTTLPFARSTCRFCKRNNT